MIGPQDDDAQRAHVTARRVTLGAATILLALLARLAYVQMFSVFARYDDEGYMMLTVHHALAGHRLYDDVWTLYGPVYFLYKWLVHGLLGLPLTHDIVRLTAIGVRLLSGVLAAFAAWRLTRSTALTVATLALVTHHLAAINNEPGHPQELCGLLAMALLALPAVTGDRWRSRLPVALGFVVAALTMTKVNIGIFAGLAVWMALLEELPAARARLTLRCASVAALAALPWALTRPLLDLPQARHFATMETLAIVAMATTAFTRQGGSARPRALIAFVTAWASGVALAVLVLGLLGSSAAAVLDSLVVGPARLPTMFIFMPPSLFPAALPAAAGAALACAVRATATTRLGPHVVGLCQLALGAITLLGAWSGDRSPLLISGVTPFLWLGLLTPPGVPEGAGLRRARLLLCWLAVLLPLQAFPVAGSQVSFGTVLHILVGAVCLAGGMGWVRSRAGDLARPRLRVAAGGLALLALTGATLWELRRATSAYDALVPLDLPGAVRLRQPLEVVQVLQRLSTALRERADTFLSVPGFSSLYFWTGKEPPTLDVIGHQMRFYSDERQAEMLRALLQHQRPMVVHFQGLAPPYPPLEAELQRRLTKAMQFGEYEVLVPRHRAAPTAPPP